MKDSSAILHRWHQCGAVVASAAGIALMYFCMTPGLIEPAELIPGYGGPIVTPRIKIALLAVTLLFLIFGLLMAVAPTRFHDLASPISKWPMQGVMQVLGPCSLFMFVGPSLMLLNKHIMQGLGFRYPLSLSMLGLLMSAVCTRVAVLIGVASVRPESLEVVSGYSWYRRALPVGICKAMALACGTSVYLHLGLGFIQMLKEFTPVIILVVMKIFGIATPSRSAVGFVVIIVCGTLVEVKGELHLTVVGLSLMLTSQIVEAINLVLTQKLLQNHKFNVIEGVYVLAPPGAGCLFIAAVVLEWPHMIREGHHAMLVQHPLYFGVAASLGLAVNFVGFLVVQATSSLTCKILNTARGVSLVFVGIIFYGEEAVLIELIGYVVALVGFIGYNVVQMLPECGDRLEHFIVRMCFDDGKASCNEVEKCRLENAPRDPSQNPVTG